MKMNKFWNKTDDKTVAINYCKKCGCELISTNKNKLCDNCQRKIVSKIKIGAGILASIALVSTRMGRNIISNLLKK